MKKITFKKLALTGETIRTLNPAELRRVGGGLQTSVVTTTHSRGGGCTIPTTETVTVDPTLGTVLPEPGQL